MSDVDDLVGVMKEAAASSGEPWIGYTELAKAILRGNYVIPKRVLEGYSSTMQQELAGDA